MRLFRLLAIVALGVLGVQAQSAAMPIDFDIEGGSITDVSGGGAPEALDLVLSDLSLDETALQLTLNLESSSYLIGSEGIAVTRAEVSGIGIYRIDPGQSVGVEMDAGAAGVAGIVGNCVERGGESLNCDFSVRGSDVGSSFLRVNDLAAAPAPSPMPEPHAVVLFGVGLVIAGSRIRTRA